MARRTLKSHKKPTYADLEGIIEYDPEGGIFARVKITNGNQKLGIMKPAKGAVIVVRGHSMTYNQVAHMLYHQGDKPKTGIRHADGDPLNFQWSTLEESVRLGTDNTKGTHQEVINGKLLEVDHTRPEQPESTSAAMRQAGKCNDCGNQPACLNLEFEHDCPGKVSADELSEQSQRLKRANEVLWGMYREEV